MTRIGDGFLVFACWLWLTIAVGPWWLGALLLVVGLILNAIEGAVRSARAARDRSEP